MRIRYCILGIVLLGVFLGLFGCAQTMNRCERMILHIQGVVDDGNLAVAKLLISHAISELDALGCDRLSCERVRVLQKKIYKKYIVDHLRSSKQHLLDKEARLALNDLSAAVRAAEDIGVKIQDIDQFCAIVLFSVAQDNLIHARDAQQRGDSETADMLYAEAAKFLNWARALDPVVAAAIKEWAGK